MNRSLEEVLERYPRISLTRLPTPLQALPSFSAKLGLHVLIKRDDLTDLTLGGDKARKLEYEVARAQAHCFDTHRQLLRDLDITLPFSCSQRYPCSQDQLLTTLVPFGELH
jgi:hypothetical protein